ncbi:MAG: thioredoxin [Proteobacteria bacterium]|nr:thioredoxin [Pseudomonadota bacterium]
MKKVLKFSASWCGPCKMLTRTLQNIITEIEIEEVDVDQNRELAQQYRIRGVPTLVMLEDDVEIKRNTGVLSKEQLDEWING